MAFVIIPSIFVGLAGTVYATTGCNAVGWDEPHGLIGCDLYYPAVSWLYKEKIASGDGDSGKFHAERHINRAEFTKIVLLANGIADPSPCKSDPFPDVPKDAWFARYVCAAKDRGIISGFPDGTFKPDIDVNFPNGSKILVKTFSLPTQPKTEFNDEQYWYLSYMKALREKHVTAPSIWRYDQLLTRGEMAEMIYRLKTGKTSFEVFPEEADLSGLGMGYNTSLSLEFLMGVTFEGPDEPYIFAPSERIIKNYSTKRSLQLQGYAFSHVTYEENCPEMLGGWSPDVCTPLWQDWRLEFYKSKESPATIQKYLQNDTHDGELYFGGRKALCTWEGVEGEGEWYCIVDLGKEGSFIAVDVATNTQSDQAAYPNRLPLEKGNAFYARIRKSMKFVE